MQRGNVRVLGGDSGAARHRRAGGVRRYTSIVAIINQLTLLTSVLRGAVVIRAREHETHEHLLVMPRIAFEIVMAKLQANGVISLLATDASYFLVEKKALAVSCAGSVGLEFLGVLLYLFSIH
jgi:ABC-2 type transport system permease protein